jgi:mannose-6-phosphate isomerase-like protein (cupin superfamily)
MTALAETPVQRPYGPIVGNADGFTTYYDLMGGAGTCRLKRLISGPQVASTLDLVEHVVFLEGASCGRHRHTRTEEIYYLLGGAGVMYMDGERLEVRGGDLVITPLHSAHTIAAFGDSNVAILVVEVLPGPEGRRADPARIAMRELLTDQAVSPADGVRIVTVELAKYFTGAWGRFRLAVLEPGAQLGPCTTSTAEEFLYLARGHARVEFGSGVDSPSRNAAGKAGLYVAVPAGLPWQVVNDSTHNSAEVVITEVLAENAQPTSDHAAGAQ